MAADIQVANHGTLWAFTALTDAAREWVAAHVDIPDYMRLGSDAHFVADHRMGRDLVAAMREAGFTVEW